MAQPLVLDAGPVGLLCHSKPGVRAALHDWIKTQAEGGALLYLPEIVDYEVRRKVLHLIETKQATAASLARLDELTFLCDYLTMTTAMWREAAFLWAQARVQGRPTGADSGLDADVLIAAQAKAVDGTVVTTNPKHLSKYVPVQPWPLP